MFKTSAYILVISIMVSKSMVGQILADITDGCAPLTVNFTAPSGQSTYYWEFDDGSSSTLQNPSNIFTVPKSPYVVSFRSCKTCPILFSKNITVYPKPAITVPSLSGCAPLAVSLTPSYSLPPGITATSMKYFFGDGTSTLMSSPNLSPATNIYPKGIYNVTLELTTSPTNAGCDNTVTINSVVKASSLILNISPNPSSGCTVPLTINFSPLITADRPIVSYDWDFGDGSTSTSTNASHTYTVLGSYAVVLKVKDDYGCEKTATRIVDINQNTLTKIISKDTVCVGTPLALSHDGQSSSNSNWNFAGADDAGFSNSQNTYAQYNTVGTRVISVTTTLSGNCPKTVTKLIHIIKPTISHSIVPRPMCNKTNSFQVSILNSSEFDSVKWYIYPPLAATRILVSDKFNDNITHSLVGLDSIRWTYPNIQMQIEGYSKYGCMISLMDSNIFSPLIAHVAPTITFGCSPLKVGFYDKTLWYRKDTLVQWILDYGDGSSSVHTSFSDTIYHTYTTRGDYLMRMIVKNKNGCIDTTYYTPIHVGTPHAVDFSINPNGGVCASDTAARITVNSLVSTDSVQDTKFWVDGFQCIGQDNLTYRPDKKAGIITVKMEVSDHGCISVKTKQINIKGPIAKFQYRQNCDSIFKVEFIDSSQLATNVVWDFHGLGTSTLRNPSFSFPSNGFYDVTLTAYNSTNSCPPSVYKLRIQIQKPIAKLDKDTFYYCSYAAPKIITANASSGYVTGNHTGFIWNLGTNIPPYRTYTGVTDFMVFDTITLPVYLTVRNFMNCISRDTALFISDSIFSDPQLNTILCSGDTVNFFGKVKSKVPIKTYRWYFGDGDSAMTEDASHSYTKTSGISSYTYTFRVESIKGCKSSYSYTLPIKKLNPKLTTGSKNLCLGSDSSLLSATTSYPTYKKWNFLPNTILYGDTIKYKFNALGNYTIVLTVIDSLNSKCKDTVTDNVTVWQKPNLGITSDKEMVSVLCDPTSISLKFMDSNNTSLIQSSKTWTVTNINGLTNYYKDSISIPLSKGANRIRFQAINKYCLDSTTRIYIVKAPRGKVDIDRNDICKGDTILFTIKDTIDVDKFFIDFGDGRYDSTSPVKHGYTYVPIGGKTVAKAIFSYNNNACQGAPVDTTIRIYEVYAKFGLNVIPDTFPICFRPVLIKDSSLGATTYFWDFGDGNTSTNQEPGIHEFPRPDSFNIKLYTTNAIYGCKDSFSKKISFLPLPISSPSHDTTCFGSVSKVFQTLKQSDVVYYWKPDSIFKSNPRDTQYVTIKKTSTIALIAVDTLTKCRDTSLSHIFIIDSLTPVYLDTIVAPGADILLPFDPPSNYRISWDKDSFLSCIPCKNPIAKYLLNPIRYEFYFVETIRNCFQGVSKYNIRIFPDILVNAPMAFTPNGDGINDIFYARGFGIKKLKYLKIFNRLGQLLFVSYDEHEGWDGSYKGVPQNSDAYFYTIEGESYIPNKIVNKEGNFLLMR